MENWAGNIRKEKKKHKKKKTSPVDEAKGYRRAPKCYKVLYHARNKHEQNLDVVMSKIDYYYKSYSNHYKRSLQTYSEYKKNYNEKANRKELCTYNAINSCKDKLKSKKIVDVVLRYFENKQKTDFIFEKKKHAYFHEGKSKEKTQKMKYFLGEIDDHLFRLYFNDRFI